MVFENPYITKNNKNEWINNKGLWTSDLRLYPELLIYQNKKNLKHQMVLLNVKRGDKKNDFLYETTVTELETEKI